MCPKSTSMKTKYKKTKIHVLIINKDNLSRTHSDIYAA